MRKLFSIIFLSLLCSASFSQDKGSIKLYGNVFDPETQKKLESVSIGLYLGPLKIDDAVTGKNGSFTFSVNPNSGEYTMKFSKSLYVSMYCTVSTKINPEQLPYDGGFDFRDVPMFKTDNQDINIYAFKDAPFNKIFYSEIKRKMAEDFTYANLFLKKVNDTNEAESKKQKEKEDQLKAEKEKVEKDKFVKEKAKQEEAERQKALQAKIKKQLEIQKALEEQERIARESAEQERLAKEKTEQEHLTKESTEKSKPTVVSVSTPQQTTSMETEAMKLKREKEEKELALKKNQAIKSEYDNELLKTVAETERNQREEEYYKSKGEEEANAVVKRVNSENDLKARLDVLQKELDAIEHNKKIYYNQNTKNEQIKSLIETAAITERTNNEKTYPTKPEPVKYKPETPPEISEKAETGLVSSAAVITVKIKGSIITYKKEIFAWGTIVYYRNEEEISERTFNKELSKYNVLLK